MKNGGWEIKGLGKVMERFEWTKVKQTHSEDTLRNPFEHQLRY
jgi:hypothetical protein